MIGIGALASLGLALPTGLAFGYGYGYGVRAGYSAFRPPSKPVNELKLSADPVQGALGAGLQSAEERTSVPVMAAGVPMTTEPSIANEASKTVDESPWVYSQKEGVPRVRKSQLRSHEDYVNFVKRGILPDGSGAGWQTKARLYENKTLNRRY